METNGHVEGASNMDEKLTVRVQTQLTQTQLQLIEAARVTTGQGQSAFVRDAVIAFIAMPEAERHRRACAARESLIRKGSEVRQRTRGEKS